MMGFIYKDEALRNECIEKGLQRSRDFSWAQSAEKLHRILLDLGS
jgi:hypothetical protein